MATILRPVDLLDRVDLMGLDVGRRLDPSRRAAFGQFFTPAPVASFMAAQVEACGDELRMLDPGAGIGNLSAAWIAHVCGRQRRPRIVHLTAYEADAELAKHLRGTMELCSVACDEAEIELHAEIIEADFIGSAVEQIADRRLLESAPLGFDCAILNPPYCKLNSRSNARRALRSVGIETSNLYAAFLWLTFRLLVSEGELVAITPRSFCNGPYFLPFRRAFLREMTFSRIHVFESRTAAFKDADVLQENIIFRAIKTRRELPAVVSSSAGPADPDICLRHVSAAEVVSPRDPEAIIHIVPEQVTGESVDLPPDFATTLSDLGIQVSTGRVVDFRSREALAFQESANTAPLIHPVHFEQGFIAWPKIGKKPNYLDMNAETCGLLVPAGSYVLVKRFSAKEEKRRVTAAVCDPMRLPPVDYGFENHLNYFHRRGQGLPLILAKGVAAYLNSTFVDSYFRQFSGHTQVNAADLRRLKYPDATVLERLGGRIGEVFPNQDDLDALIREETSMAGT